MKNNIPPILYLNFYNIHIQALYGIGNLAADNCSNRDKILENKPFMDFLLKAVKQTECPQIREDAWWTLINLAARKPLAKFDLMKDVLNFFCGDLKSIEQLSDKIFIDCLTILCQYFGKYIMKATIQLVTKYNLFYFRRIYKKLN